MTSQVKKIGTASTLLISVMMLSVPQTGFAAERMPAPLAVVQQQKTITGTIVDEKGEPIGYCPKKCVTIIFHIFHFVQNYLLSFQHLH